MDRFTEQSERNQKDENRIRKRGRLRIYFGYASGVGKTYSMLRDAHEVQNQGRDVLLGFLSPDVPLKTRELAEGLFRLPYFAVGKDRKKEFDLDEALRCRPELILVDELEHPNASGCRHARRYQDVKELLNAGIDVWTTVNVRSIESLHDTVEAITEVPFRERIPDSVFDSADQVELIDREPQELLEKLQTEDREQNRNFTAENLMALREIALRRLADRTNLMSDRYKDPKEGTVYADEHILVCLSSSPSNAKVIRTAARMASAFRGRFTALYVETSDFQAMKEEDQKRLRSNTVLAEQLGASIETVYGDDVPFQIAEFARLSGVTKVVLGRSATAVKSIFRKANLTEQLIAGAPNLDVHIIPDQVTGELSYHKRKKAEKALVFSVPDILKSVGILTFTSLLGYLFQYLEFAESNIITIYVLAVLVISIVTVNRIYSLIAAIVSVLIFNFLFTEPVFTLMAYGRGYPVTFLVMFLAALMTGSLAARLKNSAKKSAQSAFRTKVLFDTNQLMQKAGSRTNLLSITAKQLRKLLNREIVLYPAENGQMGKPLFFCTDDEEEKPEENPREREVADWTFRNNKHAGAGTQTFSDAGYLYLAIRSGDSVYGVVGIANGDNPIDTFENSILLSILGECALALENEKNAREKEEAAIVAKNEKLRANLLRAISHDLRTPLTSISGNASNLLSNADSFDEDTKKQLYLDIYDDSMWLINLVENLLSVTRLVEGRLNLRITEDLVEDVVAEALRHINRRSVDYKIVTEYRDDFLLAKMDVRLILQVIINLVDNAIKYTPEGSEIRITAAKEGKMAVISVSDNGPGISDENKKHIFEMFYTGSNQVADSHRSLGLGLALCKSIINAHEGTIEVTDNVPVGTVFTIRLPAGEVELHE